MAAFANYFDLDLGYLSHYGTFNNSDITLVKVRDIVVSVDFIDSFKASFFDHGKSTTRAFLSWLEEESYGFSFCNAVSVLSNYLSRSQDGCHMAIVATHVCKRCYCFVGKFWVILRNRQGIHIRTKSDHLYTIFREALSCSFNVDYQASTSARLYVLLLNPIRQKQLLDLS